MAYFFFGRVLGFRKARVWQLAASPGTLRLVLNIFYIIFMFISYFLIIHLFFRLRRQGSLVFSFSVYWGLMTTLAAAILASHLLRKALFETQDHHETSSHLLWVICLLFIILLLFFLTLVLYGRPSQIRKEQELALQKASYEQQQAAQLLSMEAMLRQDKHDFSGRMALLLQLLENGEIEAAIHLLREKVDEYSKTLLLPMTNNIVVNGVLS